MILFPIESENVPFQLRKNLDPEICFISCIKADSTSETYICENHQTGQKYIAKVTCLPEDIRQFKNEFDLLNSITKHFEPEEDSFPVPIMLKENTDSKGSAVYLRTYISGNTLESIVETQPNKPGLPAQEVIDYVLSVLERLSFLHGLTPPVIHLDIKPQNVIVTEQGSCALIDFGIARICDSKGSELETRGTPGFASPEQFGISQPDIRSDIYSAGVLLRYCLTGEFVPDADVDIDDDLCRIIRKASNIDPAERYKSAEQMKNELDAIKLHEKVAKQ